MLGTLEQHVAHLPSRVRSLVWISVRGAGYGRTRPITSRTKARYVLSFARACRQLGGRGGAVGRGERMSAARRTWAVLAPLGGVRAAGRVGRAVGGQLSSRRLFDPDLRDSPISSYIPTRSTSRCACTCAGDAAAGVGRRRGDTDRRSVDQSRRVAAAGDAARGADRAVRHHRLGVQSRGRLEEFIESFAPYRDRVWLVSDGSTDNTVLRLRQAGWRCFDDGVNRRKPGASAACSSDCRSTSRPSW